MTDNDQHTENVQSQFTKQATAYAESEQARNLGGMTKLAGLTNVDNKSVALDVACGPGRLTMALAAIAQRAVGLDATDALLDIAKQESAQRGLDNIDFVSGTAMQLPFGDGEFDVVTCRAAFHHFAKPQTVIQEIARVAKPGGQILIADILGNADPTISTRHDRLEQLCDPTHVHCLSADEFDVLFRDASLKIDRKIQRSITYDVHEWLKHGGPSEQNAEEIWKVFRQDVDRNELGLNVKNENGAINFSHQTLVILATRLKTRLDRREQAE